ncbi:di-heme oxidoreductase family protein [Parapedobacter koreensis]|uniref:CxxC motif-containing protein, DUF1111 family n=1 Tax=Parapedobacter koreensis TaxID=332977 RepID=A0A1H7JRS9_9SPHI|nr:di-heme oxidoredictase family protein [Parapedobacter koreensis]SEK77026.1 CxxC motif-containing protein, DUF1111 family [Parapedobacter koreensis]
MHLYKSTKLAIAFVVGVLTLQLACRKYQDDTTNPDDEWRSGGEQTVFDQGSGAFGHAFNGLPAYLARVHEVGDVQFNATFVSAPAPLNPGLGPVFNNVSCSSCHVNDGRGKIPGRGESAANMLFRVSLPGVGEHGSPLPVPGYGDQIQNRALLNYQPEADVAIGYTNESFAFGDGTSYELRRPTYTITNPYRPLPQGVLLSPRVAAPIFGLGLLEAISDVDILAREDPSDLDGDGISGRANWVWNIDEQRTTLGRFGWKANQPSLLQQTAAAYFADIGIANRLFSDTDGVLEITDSLLYAVDFYLRTLAVPGRRNVGAATVQQGKALFLSLGCSKCHIPDQRTAVTTAFPQTSYQLIHPYTDLLLHDMGEGLADNRPDFLADGNEWRTAPLWGIGLTQKVNGHTNFLHDGRARNLQEAILWHGGEAEAAKDRFRTLGKPDRDAVIAFLESL